MKLIHDLSPKARKYWLTGLVTLMGALSDLSVQLGNPQISWTRALVIGAVMGAVARIGGAVLAQKAAEASGDQPSA